MRSLCFLCLPLAVYGQVSTAPLKGTVTDPSGASIPNAAVTLTNTATGVGTTIQTNSGGGYIFEFVYPGTYDLTVHATGFRPLSQAGIHLDPNQVARLDVKLEIGSATQSVEVVAAAPLLQTQTAAVGQCRQSNAGGRLAVERTQLRAIGDSDSGR